MKSTTINASPHLVLHIATERPDQCMERVSPLEELSQPHAIHILIVRQRVYLLVSVTNNSSNRLTSAGGGAFGL